MPKEQKTAHELEEMIKPALAGFEVDSLGVHPTPDRKSWYVIVVGPNPETIGDATAAAERAARGFREKYDLAE